MLCCVCACSTEFEKRWVKLWWEDGTEGAVNISYRKCKGQSQVSCGCVSLNVWMCLNLESKYSVEITLSDPTAGFLVVFLDQAKKAKAIC